MGFSHRVWMNASDVFRMGTVYGGWRMRGHRGARVELRSENLVTTEGDELCRLGPIVFGEHDLALGTKEQ